MFGVGERHSVTNAEAVSGEVDQIVTIFFSLLRIIRLAFFVLFETGPTLSQAWGQLMVSG
jgi:hypothetical protein